jgi:predicted AAA+ superfamily ATPase
MGKLLKLTAFYAGKLVNLSELGSKLGLDRLTIKKYMALLEQLFLVEQLQAWHSNEYKRLVKTPKLHSVDTGLMCAVRGLNRDRLLKQPEDFGLVLETFVYNELRKQAVWIDEPLSFYHYRDKDKVEVDVIIENAMGECVAVEVKAAASLSVRDFTGLKRFQSVAGDRFKIGILLYDGDHTTAFGDNLYAVPLGALWS